MVKENNQLTEELESVRHQLHVSESLCKELRMKLDHISMKKSRAEDNLSLLLKEMVHIKAPQYESYKKDMQKDGDAPSPPRPCIPHPCPPRAHSPHPPRFCHRRLPPPRPFPCPCPCPPRAHSPHPPRFCHRRPPPPRPLPRPCPPHTRSPHPSPPPTTTTK